MSDHDDMRNWTGPTGQVREEGGSLIEADFPMKLVVQTSRVNQLEAALVNLIDAVERDDKAAIESAIFVGRGLTF